MADEYETIEAGQGFTVYKKGLVHYYTIPEDVIAQGVWKIFEHFNKDSNLEEIMYDNPQQPVKVFHKKYGMCYTNVNLTEEIIGQVVVYLAKFNNKIINEQKPILDGSMPDGNRLNIVIPPAASFTSITIRREGTNIISVLEMIKGGVITSEAAAFLWMAIEGLGYRPSNMLFSGGTASGKTTTMNAFMMFVPVTQRMVSIEDTYELKFKQEDVVRMKSDKEKGVSMDMLLRNALRMRPDRIVVGEVRSEETVTLFDAMNTGHRGTMGTLHANTARETVKRLTNPPMSVAMTMLSALDLILIMERKVIKGEERRFMTEITEISSSGGQTVRFNNIYLFDPKKTVLADTGIPSELRSKISQAAGINEKEFDEIMKSRQKFLEELISKEVAVDQLLPYFEGKKDDWKQGLK